MTRIIAGTAGGRRLHTPRGSGTRPTADRVREAMFSSLGDLNGSTVLDLYAGSGALGLEALSRGAGSVTFVEQDPSAAGVLRRNIDELGLPGARVVVADVLVYLRREAEPVDLVLADPPYAQPVEDLLPALVPWVGGRVVLERSTRDDPPSWPPGLVLGHSRVYGDTTLWYGRSL